MLEGLKNWIRKRVLKKNESGEPTGLLPLSKIRSAVVFIDVEDPSFDNCKIAVQNFFRERSIKGEIFFFDFRKLTEGERLITSITNTVLKKDLNWYGRPSQEKMDLMLAGEPDLFISLLPRNDFPIEYMAKCSRSPFKVGRRQLPGDIFDLVIIDPEDNPCQEDEAFARMIAMMEKIK